MTGAAILPAAVLGPLALAMLAPGLGRAVWPLYALAGAGLAVAGLSPGVSLTEPALLLGMALAADPGLAPVLIGSGAVWGAAALHARGAMGEARLFASLFGFAMAGNALLLLAEDMVSFYVGYSVMSLSAWGLIAHKRDLGARVAARLYVIFAVAGELCLFAAVILIDASGAGLSTPRAAGTPPPDLAVWLALVAFGVKAGLFPLHVWLPLAHPAAPVPASAALSGAMLKAGMVGALKLAPPGLVAGLGSGPLLGAALLGLGLFGAFGGGLYAALLAERKTVLAYSSVSQLSLALALLGAAYAGYADPMLAAGALALFSLHHALAKGALFLCVDSGLPRWAAVAAFAGAALSLTGFPLTLGAESKKGFEAALAAGGAAPLDLAAIFALAAFATAVAMARALSLPWAPRPPLNPWRALPVLGLTLASVLAALPGVAWPAPSDLAPGLVLLGLAGLLAWQPRLRLAAPAGDLLALLPRRLRS